jgi:hypothetical protein
MNVKNNKFIAFSFITLIVLGAVLMGCDNSTNEQSEKEAKLEEAKKITEKHIKENYKDIETVTFTEDKTNPMGILVLEGYINSDEEKTFSLDYDYGQKDVIGGLVLADMK